MLFHMVIWITGLSGAGKTSIGRAVLDLWRQDNPAVVLVDGDHVREILGRDRLDDYTLAGRRAVAEPIVALCKWLDGQGIDVVCCTTSSFPDLLRANRDAFRGYFEVFVDVPMEVVATRSASDLYGRAQRGEVANVIGVDIPYTPPEAPDLIVDNHPVAEDFTDVARTILKQASVL